MYLHTVRTYRTIQNYKYVKNFRFRYTSNEFCVYRTLRYQVWTSLQNCTVRLGRLLQEKRGINEVLSSILFLFEDTGTSTGTVRYGTEPGEREYGTSILHFRKLFEKCTYGVLYLRASTNVRMYEDLLRFNFPSRVSW